MKKTYYELAHAMQSGVAAALALGDKTETEPKHLRVGVNSAMVETSALTKLLVEKGVFTEDEFVKALEEQMAEEVKSYEQRLSKMTGKTVTLG